MITNAEIRIFRGDPTAGRDGWRYSVRYGNYYFKSPSSHGSRQEAAQFAAMFIDRMERTDVPDP